jgi:hypothetical protein
MVRIWVQGAFPATGVHPTFGGYWTPSFPSVTEEEFHTAAQIANGRSQPESQGGFGVVKQMSEMSMVENFRPKLKG